MKLVWFRTDLRLDDQPALTSACDQGPALGLYIISPNQWLSHPEAAVKIELWRRLLKDLQPRLARAGVALKLLRIEQWQDVPAAMLAFCLEHGITEVHCNREQGVYERRRDRATYQLLSEHGIALVGHDGQTLLAPGSLKTGAGATYRVYSPFARACRAHILQSPLCLTQAPQSCALPTGVDPDDIDVIWPDELPSLADQWPADLDVIHERL
ncbi:MAG TPA: deoxyribodipyrimidine photo-lyase, partial [Orrella sp.]